MRGIHGEKIVAALESNKLPGSDKERLEDALRKYDKWAEELKNIKEDNTEDIINKAVDLLNKYKRFIDIDLIFNSPEDFLYRQKGQLKLDNTVMEEFLPILIRKCIENDFGTCDFNISSQTPVFSNAYFSSSLASPNTGGGISIKTKDQDFSISRTLYLKASFSSGFEKENTKELVLHLGYVMAELKTNMDKTMFQEASATAHDVKLAVPGAKYYLLCDFLDMTPISTDTTDIDEILILRKGKRIPASIRKEFASFKGRKGLRSWYTDFWDEHPYSPDLFKRFAGHVKKQMENNFEKNVLLQGFF